MQNLGLVLLVAAFLAFLLSCFSAFAAHRDRLVSIGLTCLLAAEIFGGLSALHYFQQHP